MARLPRSRGRAQLRRTACPRLFAAGIVAALAVVAAGCGSGSGDPAALRGMTRQPAPAVGTVSLPDYGGGRDGELTALKPPPGQLLLVYFGYTSCPDVCPTTLADLRSALDGLSPTQRKRVAVGMVTVDPRRDTAKDLPEYLGHFFPTGVVHAFRTGDPARLKTAERAFGATHEIGRPDASGEYEVAHTALTYAIGPGGTVLVEWPFGTLPADIEADLHTLLGREVPTQ